MKKILGCILCLLAVLLCTCALAASSGTCGEHLTWELDDSGVLTISGSGDMAVYPYGLSPFSDRDCASVLKKVRVEDGVTGISEYAFAGCEQLVSVSLPASLRRIGNQAFTSCTKLKEVALPDEIAEISATSFRAATRLYCAIGSVTAKALSQEQVSFRIPDVPASLRYESIEDQELLALQKIDADVRTLVVPEQVEMIDPYVAETPSTLTSVTLPAGLKRIRINAFIDCSALRSLKLPGQIDTIESYSFLRCDAVLYSEIGSVTAKALGKVKYAFRTKGCRYDLKYMYSDEDNSLRGLTIVNVPKKETSVTVPAGVDFLDAWTFQDCKKLTKVSLPDTLVYIGPYAFENCTALKSIVLPESVVRLDYAVFSGCVGLKKLKLPSHISTIHDVAFYGCDAVLYCEVGSETAVALGAAQYSFHTEDSDLELKYLNGDRDKLSVIGGVSSKATSVVIPEGVNTLPDQYYETLFSKCTKLKYVELPDSVNSLSPAAFTGVGRDFYLKCSPGSYAEKFARSHGFQYDNGKKKVIGSDITSVDKKVSWIVSSYISAGMSEREKAKVLHNWLVYNAHYDMTYTSSEADGVLLRGSGLSDSYSKAYELLCTEAGLANRRLVGQANAMSGWGVHAWNLVRIDGQWYHVDATWDDPISGDRNDSATVSGMETTGCFLVSDSKLKKDHAWEAGVSADQNLPGPYHSNGVDYAYLDCGTFELRSASQTAALTVGKASAKSVKIPNTVNFQGKDYKVTEIYPEAFKGSKKLKSLSLGANIKKIGNAAFASCGKLKSVSGGKNLTEIGAEAFKDCKSLTAITLESKVKNIDSRAFYKCKKLKTITLKTTKLSADSIGEGAFSGIASKPTVKCPKKKLKDYQKLLPKKGMPKKAVYK